MNTVRVAANTQRQLLTLFIVTRLILFFSGAPIVSAAGVIPATSQAEVTRYAFTPEQFLNLTNTARHDQNAAPLTLNERLTQAAQAKAFDMSSKHYWNHFRPSDKKAPWDFIEEAGYSYKVAGENLARGYKTPEGITRAWLNSPAHRANILSTKYTEVGFACLPTINAEGETVLLTVEMFGAR
jgi:uncharacterized protein YkwD